MVKRHCIIASVAKNQLNDTNTLVLKGANIRNNRLSMTLTKSLLLISNLSAPADF